MYFAVTVTMECAIAGVRKVRTCQTCKVASKQRTEYGRRQTIACSNRKVCWILRLLLVTCRTDLLTKYSTACELVELESGQVLAADKPKDEAYLLLWGSERHEITRDE